jgi:hypothetical protein
MSTSDQTRDPLGLGDQPSTAVDNGTTSLVPLGAREPEKLSLSVEAVSDLLQLAIQQGAGNAWWRGFVAAHGHPSWIVAGQWRVVPEAGAEIIRLRPQER